MLVLIAFASLVGLAACDRDLEKPEGGTVAIVTTTYPLTYLAERIGGDRVSVVQLVKPGIESHDFEPSPSDVRAISNADIFIFNHPAFESWALAAVSNSGAGPASVVQTVNLESDGEDHGGQAVDDHDFDPHVWLNPLKANEQANRILAALVSFDPTGSISYVRNADGVGVELNTLDDLIKAQLSVCALEKVVVSHLAYGHMAERYGFEQIGLAGLSPEFESGPSHVASVIRLIKETGIRHILQEPIVSGRLAETVAAETGTELLVLHPLEVRTVDEVNAGEDYISIMKTNAEVLRTALQCR